MSEGVNCIVTPVLVPMKGGESNGFLTGDAAVKVKQKTVVILKGSCKPKDSLTYVEKKVAVQGLDYYGTPFIHSFLNSFIHPSIHPSGSLWTGPHNLMVNFFTTVLIRETMSLQSQHLRIC
jgi:hypothetical protein